MEADHPDLAGRAGHHRSLTTCRREPPGGRGSGRGTCCLASGARIGAIKCGRIRRSSAVGFLVKFRQIVGQVFQNFAFLSGSGYVLHGRRTVRWRGSLVPVGAAGRRRFREGDPMSAFPGRSRLIRSPRRIASCKFRPSRQSARQAAEPTREKSPEALSGSRDVESGAVEALWCQSPDDPPLGCDGAAGPQSRRRSDAPDPADASEPQAGSVQAHDRRTAEGLSEAVGRAAVRRGAVREPP